MSILSINDDLILTLYQGIRDDPPWYAFAERLRLLLDAKHVGVTLHHNIYDSQDVFVLAAHPDDAIDWQEVEATYRREFMQGDPFRLDSMQPGQVVRLDSSMRSEQYRGFMRSIGILYSLRTHTVGPEGFKIWLDVTRGDEHPAAFSDADVMLLESLQPHLEQALALYVALNRLETERVLYEGMIEHMALGAVWLNNEGIVIRANKTAQEMIMVSPHISIVHNRLQLMSDAAQQSLNLAILQVLGEQVGSDQGILIKVGGYESRLTGLLVYPTPTSPYYRGSQAPKVMLYLADLSAQLEALSPSDTHSRGRVRQLLGLTQQEATLALLLASGHSIAEAAKQMEVGETAVRNYSKNIYAKLGIARQTDLVRIIMRSFSFLK